MSKQCLELEAEVGIEPSNARRHDVDLTYGGSGRDGLDPFLMNNIWTQMFSLTQPLSDMDEGTWETLHHHLAPVRKACTPTSLPHVRLPQGTRYYTFGGSSLNKVLARWTGAQALKVTDTYIDLDHPADWSRLPATTQDLLPAAIPFSPPPGSQTIFQQNLPAELQERELSQAWLKDEEVPQVLNRLRSASLVEVREDLLHFMNTR